MRFGVKSLKKAAESRLERTISKWRISVFGASRTGIIAHSLQSDQFNIQCYFIERQTYVIKALFWQ